MGDYEPDDRYRSRGSVSGLCVLLSMAAAKLAGCDENMGHVQNLHLSLLDRFTEKT